MKSLQILGKWLTGMCIYFTIFAVPFTLIGLLISSDPQKSIELGSYMLFLPAAACISGGGILLSSRSIPKWIRILGHYLITVLSVILFIWLPNNTIARSSTAIILFVGFSALYWLIFGLVQLVRKRIRRLLEAAAD